MDLPVKFPSETEVILEDVARLWTSSGERAYGCHSRPSWPGEHSCEHLPRRPGPDSTPGTSKNSLERRYIREFIEHHLS